MTDHNPLNLLALTPIQRKIIVHLSREGPADAATLAESLDHEPAEIEQTLTTLIAKGNIHLAATGQAEVNLGRTRRRKLPARLQPGLLATSRLYSAQEIATLRTAIPMLQFARAKLGEFVDHGPGHVLRVKSFATQLGYILGLTPTEQHLLRAAAFFHDVGNVVDRARHHIISQETVEKLAATGHLPFSPREAALVGLLCRWHRKEYDPNRYDKLGAQTVRIGLLASILRVADAMDIDQRRSDYSDQFSWVRQFFYPEQLPYWASLEEILGVRIRYASTVNLQIFTQGQISQNVQIELLRKDLDDTPLEWPVQQIAVPDKISTVLTASTSNKAGKKIALLVFPFDPHSLVMAALSHRHLQEAGYAVKLLCYPDTADGSAWLWGEALAETNPVDFTRLVIIGDRPGSSNKVDLLAAVDRWQTAGTSISLLNRYEANWSQLPELLEREVEIILGGDWAYFWGDKVSQADLVWGRIAALCTRDPTQSTVGLTAEEQAVTQGLLKVVYDAINRSADDIDGWIALAQPILDRIEHNDQTFFVNQSASFAAMYATPPQPNRVEGQVLRFKRAPGSLPQAYYWALEAAIEHYGRTAERGISFSMPYAIATWPDGDVMELLAINHWRDEDAIPIRLLYPTDLGPAPEGNESTIQVRLPVDQAEAVVQALVEACNQN